MTNASRKTQINRCVPHSVEQAVARGAQHPNLFRPSTVFDAAPRTEPCVLRTVRDLHDARLSARLTRARRIGVIAVKSDVLAVRQRLFARARTVRRFRQRATRVVFTNGFIVLQSLTGRRAQPLVSLVRPDRELCAAIPTVVMGYGGRGGVLFEPTRFAPRRAVLAGQVRSDHFGAANDARVLSAHASRHTTFCARFTR